LWILQLEEAALEMFENITQRDSIPIDMNVPGEPQTLEEYIESWRMKLWDKAFTRVFKGADAFKKFDSFASLKGSNLTVKRLIYKYYSASKVN